LSNGDGLSPLEIPTMLDYCWGASRPTSWQVPARSTAPCLLHNCWYARRRVSFGWQLQM